ncbi:P-II family nitrogen regulator [Coralloluteibacterium thermophilus]|uniref:P-II family nitrogen regulator n=1 Tax=Coralloluteibacterium thermophilum TaxID=2707049 RepID=A0ABV9NK52_9GAMM
MNKHPKTLLVIIAEAALERELVRAVRRFGAHGYTVHDVRGAGTTGAREGAWEADRTIEMKVVCDPEVGDRIAEHVLAAHGDHFGLTLFFADVAVVRADKY